MTSTKKISKWQAGTSGNPQGRPVGAGELGKLRASIAEHLPAIIDQLVSKAIEGDSQAARLLLERVLPSLKPIDQTQAINLPDGTLTEQGRAVLACVASGELAAPHGAQLLTAIGILGKITELDELTTRITALEAGAKK